MPTPLCAVSGLPIGEGCPTVAYVVVRRRTGTTWSPLGFGYRGLQSGPHMLADVTAGPLTDYTRKLLLPGLRRRDGISRSLPRDIEPGEIGRLLAEERLIWDSGRGSAEIVEHRVGVMRVRADAYGALVADMGDSPRGLGLLPRVQDVMALMCEMHAEPRGEDGKIPEDRLWTQVDRLVVAQKAMGAFSTLLSDNHGLVGGAHETALFDAVTEHVLLDASLDAIGTGWHPSRTVDDQPDVGFVQRFHANVALLAKRA